MHPHTHTQVERGILLIHPVRAAVCRRFVVIDPIQHMAARARQTEVAKRSLVPLALDLYVC